MVLFKIELQCREHDTAMVVLMTDYGKTVGIKDGYSFSEAAKRIEASGHTAGRKERLKNTLRLVAQARTVDIA